MPDLTLDQTTMNGNVSPTAAQEEGSSGGFDLIQVLWRWKWLPILGAIVGGCIGFLIFSRQSKTFIAQALVQIDDSVQLVQNPIYDPQQGITRDDETLVIRSQAVLTRAVKLGRLTEQTAFQGLEAEEIVAVLKSEDSPLVIEPAAKNDKTTLIRIAYVAEDPDAAAKVVVAIVDGYESYLLDQFKSVGAEVSSIIEKAHGELTSRVNEISAASKQFKDANPDIVFVGDEANDPYHQTFLSLHEDLNALRTQLSKLQSVSSKAKELMAGGSSPDAIFSLLALSGASTGVPIPMMQGGQADERPGVDFRTDTQSKRLEQQRLFDLRIRLKVLTEKFGEEHPNVATVRKEIELVQRQVNELREAEKILEDEIRKIDDEHEQKTGQRMRTVTELLDAQMQALDSQIAALQLEEKNLSERAEKQKRMSRELQGMLDGYRILRTDREAVATLLGAYTKQLQEIDLMPKSGQRTLRRLDMPRAGSPYGPLIVPFLLGGAAFGVVLLSGLAILMDLADRSYRNPSEISSDLGVQVLGHIPVMNTAKVKPLIDSVDPAICAIHHSKGRVAEAYRSVRTSLYFSNKGKELKVLQVTSPVPGDGKSTLSANIAVTMAQSGRRVLLIDADLRRPRVAKIFGIETEIGVAAVISGKTEIDDAICTGPVANLSILPGGKRPPNPAEILSSDRFRNMIELLKDKFDMIVIDTPPLLAVSDPGAVAGIVDGVLVTMRLRRNVKPLATRAKDILDSVGANLLGVVINGVSSEAGYGYNYDYNDYRYAYKYGSNYRTGYGYRYGYGNYRYGYSKSYDEDLASVEATTKS